MASKKRHRTSDANMVPQKRCDDCEQWGCGSLKEVKITPSGYPEATVETSRKLSREPKHAKRTGGTVANIQHAQTKKHLCSHLCFPILQNQRQSTNASSRRSNLAPTTTIQTHDYYTDTQLLYRHPTPNTKHQYLWRSSRNGNPLADSLMKES